MKEDHRCCMCNGVVNTQNLRETINDKTNEKDIINQAKLLIALGFKETDNFCQECFWK